MFWRRRDPSGGTSRAGARSWRPTPTAVAVSFAGGRPALGVSEVMSGTPANNVLQNVIEAFDAVAATVVDAEFLDMSNNGVAAAGKRRAGWRPAWEWASAAGGGGGGGGKYIECAGGVHVQAAARKYHGYQCVGKDKWWAASPGRPPPDAPALIPCPPVFTPPQPVPMGCRMLPGTRSAFASSSP